MAGALALALGSTAAQAQPLDYAQALEQAQRVSGPVRSARLDAEAKALQAEAVAHLGAPALSLSAFSGRVSSSFNLDVSRLAGAVNPIVGGFDNAVPGLDLPTLPDTLSTRRTFDLNSYGLAANWPLYTAGRLEAVHGLALGRASEARAELQEAVDSSSTLTAQRYFTVQLARQAWQLRGAAAAGIAEHQSAALRLERIGLIATAERLRADVALDGARRDLARAASDLELAQVALDRLLAAAAPVQPSTPLFVHRQPVGTLQSFIDAGLQQHPAWRKLASKREQAGQSLKLQGGAHEPTVFAVGAYNVNHSRDELVQPNWFVGVYLSVPLVGHVDKGKLQQAARLDLQRVEASAEQAARDIPTLIESQWRALENARAQFLSMDSAIALARENLRLQTIAFQQSQATTLDVTDAHLALARTGTERVQAAYDYVLALARLLEATGQPERLAALAASADVRLPLAAVAVQTAE
jgi:outer membrane protein TolC